MNPIACGFLCDVFLNASLLNYNFISPSSFCVIGATFRQYGHAYGFYWMMIEFVLNWKISEKLKKTKIRRPFHCFCVFYLLSGQIPVSNGRCICLWMLFSCICLWMLFCSTVHLVMGSLDWFNEHALCVFGRCFSSCQCPRCNSYMSSWMNVLAAIPPKKLKFRGQFQPTVGQSS